MSDRDLIATFLNGNELALAQLIHRHKNRVFGSILLKVKERNKAEDLFQEVFINAIDNIRKGKYHDKGKFSQWLMCIAHNRCMDYFRKQKNTPKGLKMDNDEVLKRLRFQETNFDMHYDYEKREGKLKDLIELLPDEQKEVLILRHFFDFSFKEVAEYTNTNINTCLGRMRYALANLRKIMAQHNLALKTFVN